MEASATVPASSSSAGASYYELLVGQAEWADVAVMGVGGVAALVHGASIPVFLHFLGKLIDSLGSSAEPSDLMANQVSKYVLYFVYLSLVRLGTGWIEVSMWMYNGERQVTRLRRRYLKALLSQHVGFFDTNVSTGEVLAHIASDTILIQESIGAKTGNLIHCMSQFLTGMTIAFLSLWQLSLLTLAVLPVMAMSGVFSAYAITGLAARSQGACSRAGEVAHEVIAQIRTVQSFAGEKKALQMYLDPLLSAKKLGIRAGLAKGVGIGSQYGLGFASFALLLWFAGRLVRNGLTIGGEAFTTILIVIASSFSLGQAALT